MTQPWLRQSVFTWPCWKVLFFKIKLKNTYCELVGSCSCGIFVGSLYILVLSYFYKSMSKIWSGASGPSLTCLSFKCLQIDSFQTDSTWQMFPLTYHFTSSHLLSFSSTCLSILTTWASRLSLAWLNWWSKGPAEQNNLFCKAKQGERKKKSNGGGQFWELR